jgi:L-fuconolactonase
MRIDAHQHYWDIHRFDYFWMNDRTPTILKQNFLPADLKPIYLLNRIDGSVLVQATHSMEETWWSLELAASEPSILGVVAWVDLMDPRLGDTLDKMQLFDQFKGVRHLVQDEPDDKWILQHEVIEGLEELARRGIPFDLCIHPRHLPLIPTVADRVPDLRMVVDHLAKPFIEKGDMEPWAKDMSRLAQYKQIYCKLSGMITEAGPQWKVDQLRPYVTHCVTEFGPTRCMFGSDWPVCLVGGTWKQVLASFTQALGAREVGVREKLMGLTAQEFYGL